jgi:hypothetical protein
MESTETAIYRDMLREWLMPQLQKDISGLIYQKDRAPPRFHNAVTRWLNESLSNRFIGHGGAKKWPSRSNSMTQ